MLVKFSIREAAQNFGVDRAAVTTAYKEAGIKTGRGVKHTVAETHQALNRTRGNKQRLEAARLKVLEEEGQLKELERKQKERELVSLAEVVDMVVKVISAVPSAIKDMPARLAPKCNPGDPVLAREELKIYAAEICQKVDQACKKLISSCKSTRK